MRPFPHRQGGQNYSYLYDGKGNVTALIDSSQGVAATYTYAPFGNLMSQAGTLSQPFKFSTKVYDSETGLSYFGYRFYAPALGRWMTRDPIGYAGGLNLYGFAGNNPINLIDLWGLLTEDELVQTENFFENQKTIAEEYRKIAAGEYSNSYQALLELMAKSETIADTSGYRSDLYSNLPQEVKDIVDIHESYHYMYFQHWFFHFLTAIYPDLYARLLAMEEFRAYAISNRLLKELLEKEGGCTSD